MLVYEWDDAFPADTRTHNIVEIRRACPAHAGLSVFDHGVVVRGENGGKNRALTALAVALGVSLDEALQNIDWSFDGSRRLQLRVTRALKGQAVALQTAARAAVGTVYPNVTIVFE